MAVNNGPASGNAELLLGAAQGNAGVAIEVQVPSGLPSLSPQDAPNIYGQRAGQSFTGSSPAAPASAFQSTVVGVRFAIPA